MNRPPVPPMVWSEPEPGIIRGERHVPRGTIIRETVWLVWRGVRWVLRG